MRELARGGELSSSADSKVYSPMLKLEKCTSSADFLDETQENSSESVG